MILVATDTPFWQPETAAHQRVAAMIAAMHAHFSGLSVYVDDSLEPAARDALDAAHPGLTVHDLPQQIKIRRMRRNRFRSIARRLGATLPPGPLVREQREHFARVCGAVRPRIIVCTTPRLAALLGHPLEPPPAVWTDCSGCWLLREARAPHEVAEATLERASIARFDGLIAASAADAQALRAAFHGKAVVVAAHAPFHDLVAALEEAG